MRLLSTSAGTLGLAILLSSSSLAEGQQGVRLRGFTWMSEIKNATAKAHKGHPLKVTDVEYKDKSSNFFLAMKKEKGQAVPVPSGSAKDIKTNQGKGAEHASGNSQHKAGEGHVLPPNAAANAVNATASLGKVPDVAGALNNGTASITKGANKAVQGLFGFDDKPNAKGPVSLGLNGDDRKHIHVSDGNVNTTLTNPHLAAINGQVNGATKGAQAQVGKAMNSQALPEPSDKAQQLANNNKAQAPKVDNRCSRVQPPRNVDLKAYAAKPWFVHQQMATESGNPDNKWNACVMAKYTIKDGRSLAVYNRAYEGGPEGTLHEANLCAVLDDPRSRPAELKVGPCFLPQMFYGPYWVLAYSESEGYAIVSGGNPTIPTENGLCKTGSGVNNSGLWILTRSSERREPLITKARALAQAMGFDVAVLRDVNHAATCKYA